MRLGIFTNFPNFPKLTNHLNKSLFCCQNTIDATLGEKCLRRIVQKRTDQQAFLVSGSRCRIFTTKSQQKQGICGLTPKTIHRSDTQVCRCAVGFDAEEVLRVIAANCELSAAGIFMADNCCCAGVDWVVVVYAAHLKLLCIVPHLKR